MTDSQPLYLKQNVQLEPLVDQWYAWSHLISPATAARNITERHLRIMDSYISSPQVHANAVRNPKMMGGPFVDYEGKRVDEIKALRDRTKQSRRNMIDLSTAIADLDSLLRTNASGYTLTPLYEKVPACLRGYVELVYGTNNSPTFKIIEPLLYKSPFYDASAQSLMLSITKGDHRSFVLSTPRLEDDNTVHMYMPFADERVDQLFTLKHRPRPWGEIKETFGLNGESERFQSLLTPEPPRKSEAFTGEGIRWRYLGHACVLIETPQTTLLFDPVLSYSYDSEVPRYTYEDLPDSIDYVLLTHNHQDHVMFETLLQIRHKVKTIVVPRNVTGSLQDPSMKLMLRACGFKNVLEAGDMESIPLDGGEIIGLPFFGEHADLDVQAKTAYYLRLGNRSFVFAADSCNIEPNLYEHLHRDLGDVDVLFLGMECDGAPLTWVYGPLLGQRPTREMDESRRLNGSDFDQAIEIVKRFNFKEVYVYAMGQEPWLNHVMSIKYTPESRPIVESNRLIEACRSRGIVSERLFGRKSVQLN
ncbi:MAG TPA: MBL fold metallo-hydrolase [Pyrinomonadaceae bacterium]|nr:MBL fold metallo-hydrolase [Pyrinomonadaceae bacterium]